MRYRERAVVPMTSGKGFLGQSRCLFTHTTLLVVLVKSARSELSNLSIKPTPLGYVRHNS